jgi:hypothetical protein
MLPRCCHFAIALVAVTAAGCATGRAPEPIAAAAPEDFCRDVIQTLAAGDRAGAERAFRRAATSASDLERLNPEIDKTVSTLITVIALRTNGMPLGYVETLATPAPAGHVATIERWQSRANVNIYFGCSVRTQPVAGEPRIQIQLSDTAGGARKLMDEFHRGGGQAPDEIEV